MVLSLWELIIALHITSLSWSTHTHTYTQTNNSHPSIPAWPRFKFINKTSKLADTAVTPSKINSFARGKREPVCVCVCVWIIAVLLCRPLQSRAKNLFGQLLNVLVPPQRLGKPCRRCIFYKLAHIVYQALSLIPGLKLCLPTEGQPGSVSRGWCYWERRGAERKTRMDTVMLLNCMSNARSVSQAFWNNFE